MATASTIPNLAPMSVPFSGASKISAISPQNPETKTPQEQYFSTGNVSDEDQKMLVTTVAEYRNQWATDRLERFRVWMKNVLMYKGTQVLQWDSNQNMWFDALGWYRQNNQGDGEEVNLERWINNITLMLGTAFVGNMSRGVPQTVVRPENANVLADVTTARAASEAIAIIERRNQGRQMVRGEFEMLYLFGCYFKYTRGVLDGNWSGYDEEPIFGMKIVSIPARKKCYGCAKETPMSQLPGSNVQACPNCGMGMGGESYYPAEDRQSLTVVGTRRVPRAMVRQTIHHPMEIDADPSARKLEQTPILNYDQEIDIGEARMMLPAMRTKLTEGSVSSTTPNADYERLRRSEVTSVTAGFPADTMQQRPTYSQTWMQPISFYRMGEFDFGDRMLAAFPNGLRLTMCGDDVVDIRPAVMVKQWSHCRLHEGFGLYCPSIAERVVPFNERFNSTMQILDDWAQRAATGLNVVAGDRIDTDRIKGRSMGPSELLELPMKLGGDGRLSLQDAFAHFDMPLNPAIWNYPQMLLTFCELIAGMPPQSFGSGTQPGVETFGGQQQMLHQANTAMQPYWENVKEEHALAAQNAIECLQQLMACGAVKEIVDVVEAMGSAFRNNYVNWNMMQGRVKVYPDEDQGLPQTADDIRSTFQMIFQELSKGNEAARVLFDIPVNQETMLTVLAPELEAPLAAQRAKTLQDINTLLENDWQFVQAPDGSFQQQLPIMPEKNVDDFPTAKETFREFRKGNFMLRVQNPQGWARLDAYYDMLEDLDMQVAADQAKRQSAVQQAGAPPKPGPNPQQAGVVAELQKLATSMADRLAQLAMLDPAQTKGTASAQVSAGYDVMKSAIDATKAIADQ